MANYKDIAATALLLALVACTAVMACQKGDENCNGMVTAYYESNDCTGEPITVTGNLLGEYDRCEIDQLPAFPPTVPMPLSAPEPLAPLEPMEPVQPPAYLNFPVAYSRYATCARTGGASGGGISRSKIFHGTVPCDANTIDTTETNTIGVCFPRTNTHGSVVRWCDWAHFEANLTAPNVTGKFDATAPVVWNNASCATTEECIQFGLTRTFYRTNDCSGPIAQISFTSLSFAADTCVTLTNSTDHPHEYNTINQCTDDGFAATTTFGCNLENGFASSTTYHTNSCPRTENGQRLSVASSCYRRNAPNAPIITSLDPPPPHKGASSSLLPTLLLALPIALAFCLFF